MTGAMSRRKGKSWELACRKALAAIGIPCRAPQVGEAGDDIVLLQVPSRRPQRDAMTGLYSIECKDQARDALPSWVDQSVRQAGEHRVGIVWHKRRGKPDPMDGFVTMRARDFWERVA
jgi:hypothetical protein